jgi:hypothetical protein
VKSVLNGTTTYYVGNHFEWTGSTTSMIKYYYAGSQRVAMRKGNPGTVSFLLGDHLGSTSLTANSSGARVAELRYKPWGESRYISGTTPTSYPYTLRLRLGRVRLAKRGIGFNRAYAALVFQGGRRAHYPRCAGCRHYATFGV